VIKEKKKMESIFLENDHNSPSNEITEKSKLKKLQSKVIKYFKNLSGIFFLYFLVTVLFYGLQDFILSLLAYKNITLSTGDTLAFLTIGNLIGTILAKVILNRWKLSRWAKIMQADHDNAEAKKTLIEEFDLKDIESPSITPTSSEHGPSSKVHPFMEDIESPPKKRLSKFDKIRSLLKTPEFLKDTFKLCFLSGLINSVAPLGYYMLSVNGAEASTVAPLISLYVIVPTILGLIVLKEKKSILKFTGIIFALGAVVLLALGAGPNWTLLNYSNMFYFSLGFFGWGIAYYIRGLAALKGIDFEHMILMCTAGLILGNYLLINFWFGVNSLKFSKEHALTMLAGCSGVIGDVGFFLLSKQGKEASKVVPLTGTYILVPSILGFVFLNNTVTIFKIVGIVVSLLALGLLGAS